MQIDSIKLINFRNYSELDLNFDADKILLTGKNAQGKTNLLEAICFLSSLKTIKAKQDSELIKWGQDFAHIKGHFTKNQTETTLEVTINPPKKKLLKVNEIKKNKSSEYLSNIFSVCFSTSDLALLRGNPDDRRSWLDEAVSSLYPAHADRISKYNKIRTQKNNLLKTLAGNINADKTLLDVWNEQLAITGSNIILLRLNFLKELLKYAKLKHSYISVKETLSIFYESSIIDTVDVEDVSEYTSLKIAEIFHEKLEEKKAEEIIRAQSVIGPHRDDISFFIDNADAKKFASQGQQRTIVLALKLAETDLIKAKTGYNAILLLDDVLAELDDIRQTYLLNGIEEKHQTIITSVDTLHFDKRYLENVKIYKIIQNENGADLILA
ncbi:MAG: DNA replication/repair protein RecF [Candidatus Gastranaerophilales bacterium]|nr:DNA replication/repair protein RecF [Candidatus Gastranaerophilales bacterium]